MRSDHAGRLRALGARVLAVTLLAARVAHPQAVTPESWATVAVSNDEMERRIASTVPYVRGGQHTLALFDVAYPYNAAEYDSMAGNALLLVTVLVHDSTRFPVAHVVVRSNGRIAELLFVRTALIRRTTMDSVAKTFGRFREDILCLLPVPLPKEGGDVFAIFPDGSGIGAGSLGTQVPPPVADYLKRKAAASVPNDSVLAHFIAREYPDFPPP
jgi:hypothetical protein